MEKSHMSDDAPKLPHKQVFKSLLEQSVTTAGEVASLNGELGESLRTQYDLNKDFKPAGWGNAKRIYRVFKTQSELKARDQMRQIRVTLDALEVIMNEEGHGADFAEMAANAAEQPKGSQPKEDTDEQQVKDNIVRLQNGIKEPEPKKKGKGKGESTFVEEQREENAKGDALIQENLEGRERLPDPDEDPENSPGRFGIKY
jgi:hypothetical protein